MPRAKGSKNKVPKRQVERTPTQVQAHRARIQEMDLKGYTQVMIARSLDISQPLVSLELKAIRQEYHDAYVDDRKALVLLEQPFIKDPATTVGDLLKAVIAKTGENVVIRRFVKFGVGQE